MLPDAEAIACVRNMMTRWFSSLSLLTLLSLAGGSGVSASELDAGGELAPKLNAPEKASLTVGDVDAMEPQVAEHDTSPSEPDYPKGTDPDAAELSAISPLPTLPDAPLPATTVTEWLAQIEAARVQITNVRVEETVAGLRIILDTAEGELTAPTMTVSGNALVAEIPNAVLALPEGDEFQQFEPVQSIALVQVTELPGDRVQVVITGADAPPIAEISTTATGLMLSIAPGNAQADVADDEALRVVVEGEEGSRYVEPTATTGTRTDTPLRDIPQSIQIIPREVLEDQQVIRLNDALRNVSGAVSAGQTGTAQRSIIRGFEDPQILRDGFRLTFGGLGNPGFPELANLETIEVLKGPGSILFGSAEPGGVINLVSKQPLSEPFYNLRLRAGSRTLIEPSLDFSGPLTADGRLLYRLNALVRREESFRDYDTDSERSFIAPTISWQISDLTDLTFHFEYSDTEGPSDSGLVAIGEEVADIPFDRVLGNPADFFQSELVRVGYNFEHRFSDRWQVRNAFRFNSFDVDSFSSSVNVDEATGDTTISSFTSEQENNNLELQTNVVGEFNTGAIEHQVLFGVDLFRYTNPRLDTFDFFSPVSNNIFNPVDVTFPLPDPSTAPVTFDGETRIDALSVYIQDQVNLLDNLILLAGIRYETVEQEAIRNPTFFSPTASETTLNEDAFSPRIGLVYQPIDEVSLYGSFSRSFIPNTATTFENEIIPPERGEQFEIGVRAELLEGRFTTNLALFHITKQNVANPDPNNPRFFVATGELRSRGVELDIAGEILPGWNVIANYAYTDADITEDNTGIEDNRLFGVPENNFNLWTTYDIQAGSLEGLGFGLGFNYVDERFGDNDNSFQLDNYFLTNAAVSYERDNWRAALNIRNLFDIDYIEGSRNSRSFGVSPGEGLTLIGSFSIDF